jgi:acetyltransferase-like isoleucine patch superfamily enzyme
MTTLTIRQMVPTTLKRTLHRVLNPLRFRDSHIERACWIDSESVLGKGVRLGESVSVKQSSIGDYSYLGYRCEVNHATIGKFCSISAEVFVGLGQHPLGDRVSTHPLFYLHRPENGWDVADRDFQREYFPTSVGNDVWLGHRASLKGGITVGDGAVVGAGAVVTADVPPYAIVAGVPAKPIRYRFDPETIEFLLRLKWWDRDEAWLRANWQAFHDIRDFRERVE